MLKFYAAAVFVVFSQCLLADSLDTDSISLDSSDINELLEIYDKTSQLTYETGTIDLGDMATLKVPDGFKYLNAEQSAYVLTTVWGNPPSATMGLLFPDSSTALSPGGYVVEISFENEGYVEDDDAADIDYDDLLEEIQQSTAENNKMRVAQGYGEMQLIGWAAPPYYDAESKKLHWAKELSFEDQEVNTLNYNIRILGRKGYMVLNAIADMNDLSLFDKDKEKIISSVEFNEGYTYSEFDPKLDKVAAYGIGGLIAGKVLAKAGLFALLLKNIKLIIIGIVAAFAAFRKRIFGGRKNEQ